MRLVFLFALLLSLKSLSAQSSDFSSNKFNINTPLDLLNIDTKIIQKQNSLSFSVYNEYTNRNDYFLINRSGYTSIGSSNLPQNIFRRVKIDSYNPNGANNFGSAVALGLLNSIIPNNQ